MYLKAAPLKILNIGVAAGAGSDMLSAFAAVVSSEDDQKSVHFLYLFFQSYLSSSCFDPAMPPIIEVTYD
jgi:hypothetical protein